MSRSWKINCIYNSIHYDPLWSFWSGACSCSIFLKWRLAFLGLKGDDVLSACWGRPSYILTKNNRHNRESLNNGESSWTHMLQQPTIDLRWVWWVQGRILASFCTAFAHLGGVVTSYRGWLVKVGGIRLVNRLFIISDLKEHKKILELIFMFWLGHYTIYDLICEPFPNSSLRHAHKRTGLHGCLHVGSPPQVMGEEW